MAKKSNVEKELVSAAAAPARVRKRPAASGKKHSAAEPASAETKTVKPTRAGLEPSREEIAKLAFLYWEARGCQGGSPEEDWLRAERELGSR